MSRSYAILGAGLMGRMMAYALAKDGAVIALFERSGPDAEQSAARVAASMLAPLAESAITEPSVVRMGLYGLDRWKSLIEQLNREVEQQTFFAQNGTLVLWHRLDAAEAQRFAEHLERNVRMNPALSSPWHLDSKALAELEPSVAERFAQGLFLPREGQLDNRQLLTALLQALQQLPVTFHWDTACEPEELKGQAFDWVIDCRGLGAKTSWSNTHNPLRGVRGEVIRVHAPEVKLQRPTRLIHPRYPIYIAPKENDLYVIGATEIESEDLSPASVRSSMELLSAAYSVHSGFAEARILESATQCRPTLKNNLPEICVPRAGLMQINGLYRHGYLIAPALVDTAQELLQETDSALARCFDIAVHHHDRMSSFA
jgi:glycine oxidase